MIMYWIVHSRLACFSLMYIIHFYNILSRKTMKKNIPKIWYSHSFFFSQGFLTQQTCWEKKKKNHFIHPRSIWKGSHGRLSMLEEEDVLYTDRPNILFFNFFPNFIHCFIQYQTNNDHQKIRNDKSLNLTQWWGLQQNFKTHWENSKSDFKIISTEASKRNWNI